MRCEAWILSCLLTADSLGAQAPAGPAIGPPTPVEWSQLVPRQRPVPPAFPPLARLAGVQGQVAVRIVVDPSGGVVRAEAFEGPALLRPAAESWCRLWRFTPIQVDGTAVPVVSRMGLGFRLKEVAAALAAPVGVVLEVEAAPSVYAVPVDLAALRAEARRWLESLGLAPAKVGHCDPDRTLDVKLVIQSIRTPDGLYLHEVQVRACFLRDWRLPFDTPEERMKACFSTHLLAQRGEEGFQASLMETVRRSLQDLSAPLAPLSPPARGRAPGAVPTAFVHGKVPVADFDFSQIRVRYQPPTPPYPVEAKARRVQGTVVIELTVGPNGMPVRTEAIAGPPELLATAIRYAMAWQFDPARLNGPQYARFRLTMPFRLH